jgi:hypothetical protein
VRRLGGGHGVILGRIRSAFIVLLQGGRTHPFPDKPCGKEKAPTRERVEASKCPSWRGRSAKRVFALDVPAIYVFLAEAKTWMPGTRPGMTTSGESYDGFEAGA